MARAPERDQASPSPDATASQLRRDIDSGRTGDKVAAPDPSAVPLGTDDESAGQPPQPAQVRDAMRRERAGAPRPRRSTLLPWTLAVLGATMAVVVVLALL